MRSIGRNQLIMLIAILWIASSVIIWLVFPTARKGPLGFGPPAEMTTFQAKDGKYTISYPANWSAFDLEGSHGDHEVIATILVAGKSLANVTIARKSFPNGTVNDVSDWGKSRATQHDDYLVVSFLPLNDSDLNGFTHTYKWSSPTLNNKVIRYCQDNYILADDFGYDLSFCSKEKDWSFLESTYLEMMQSFSVMQRGG